MNKKSDAMKKAKMNYLNILAGNTAGNVEGLGKLKQLKEHEESKMKQSVSKSKKKV